MEVLEEDIKTNGDITDGQKAIYDKIKSRLQTNDSRIICSIKRLIGGNGNKKTKMWIKFWNKSEEKHDGNQ